MTKYVTKKQREAWGRRIARMMLGEDSNMGMALRSMEHSLSKLSKAERPHAVRALCLLMKIPPKSIDKKMLRRVNDKYCVDGKADGKRVDD